MSENAEIVFPLDWEFRIVALSGQIDRVQAVCLGILHRTDSAAVISRGLGEPKIPVPCQISSLSPVLSSYCAGPTAAARITASASS